MAERERRSIRERAIKALGGVPIEATYVRDIDTVVATAEMAMGQQGMIDTPFGPGSPQRPFNGYNGTPRSRDYQTGTNISSRPRINEQISFSTLKGLVKSYDLAQIAIWHRIDSIRSMDWHLVPKKGVTEGAAEFIALGMTALDKPDREVMFKTWLAKYLFDILAYDAGTLYKIRNGADQPIGLRVLDGSTIAPLLDDWGNRPTGNAPAFVQFAQGVPWEWLRDDDLIYEPFRPQSDSMYGTAPMESILLNANTDLRFQQYFLGRFTQGNVPEGFAGSPEGWTPDQIQEYQESWDAMLYGDEAQKHQIKWVPHGTTFDWSNESSFSDEFSLFLLRKTASAYHITPADLGFTDDVNRSSGETQADVQFRVGDLPLSEHVAGILTNFLQNDLHLPIAFEFETGRLDEDRLAVAQANKIYVDMGAVGVSEVREDIYGLDEPGGVPVPRYIMTSAGPVPLSALSVIAGPIDKETGAPLPGATLPAPPFEPAQGVIPKTPPYGELAPPVVGDPLALPAPSATPLPNARAGVVKGEGVGITEQGGTVAHGTPLVDDEVDKNEADSAKAQVSAPVETDTDPVTKASEDRAFRTFLKARKRDGKWRDFEFHAATTRESQERNRFGRAQVRKAAGDPSVAGLCVLAQDTGRVLMLQRGLDPTDPAAGKWEFPGGHIEDGEDVLTAAVREWCEETGCVPPLTGSIVSQWTSANFIYQGIVLSIPHESDVAINRDAPFVANPDDPDGDMVETCAWWNPADLEDNPVVRAELGEDLNLVLTALAGPPESSVDEMVVKAQSAWSQHPFRRIEEPLIEHHAPAIQSGLRALVSKADIRSAVEAYIAEQESRP